MDEPRVELQVELPLSRERVFELVSSSSGLGAWLDEAELEARPGARVRLRLRDALVEGAVLACAPPQHISFRWDYPEQPLPSATVVAFDAIAHGARTHLTLRHVGFGSVRERDLHAALWRYWFDRFKVVARRQA
jgi:uncharacterized protein YndB with AHSA1/START domain